MYFFQNPDPPEASAPEIPYLESPAQSPLKSDLKSFEMKSWLFDKQVSRFSNKQSQLQEYSSLPRKRQVVDEKLITR